MTAVIIAVFVAALLAIGAVSTMLIWNIGIIGAVLACGGSISKIGFWTALFLNLLWGGFTAHRCQKR